MHSEEDKKRKKDTIVEAAMKAFAELGYEKTKISDVAARAGIGKGSFYDYFKSKEELVLEVVERIIQKHNSQSEEIVEGEMPTIDKLQLLYQSDMNIIRNYGDKCAKPNLMAISDVEDFPEKMRNLMFSFFGNEIDIYTRVLELGVEKGEIRPLNTKLAAILIMGATAGYINVSERWPDYFSKVVDREDRDSGYRYFLEMVVQGIGAE